MTKERLKQLIEAVGPIAPEGVEDYIGDLIPEGGEMIPREVVAFQLEWNHVPEHMQKPLFEALDVINGIPELVELSQVLAKDCVRALNRNTAISYEQPKPACLSGFARDSYAFFYTQLCVLEGRKALKDRCIPEKYAYDIPERMTRKQLSKYVATGDINFDDYGWDQNFYCCDIFLLDRFYFIPYRWGDTPQAWRNKLTGMVVALWKGGQSVRRDGQLDGVNGIKDENSFVTIFEENEDSITGNPVDPQGIIRPEPMTLFKSEWTKALGYGDYTIALHIPGGQGYTPERVKSSCTMALDFYKRYFPEYDFKGFWSESWLYDPGLVRILGPDRNISRVQRQFYNYPTMEGDDMARREVLHDLQSDYRTVTPKTTLEKSMFAAWDRGERFHTTGMFLLNEEVPKLGSDPYHKEG